MTHAEQSTSRPARELPADLVSRSDGLRVRSVDEGKRQASFVASTDSIDSYDERVEQDWDLERYKRNPIVLYAHDRWDRLPIGQAVHCAVEDGELVCTLQFASAEANPEAEQIWQLVREKVLRAVSVGFQPHAYRWEKEDDHEVLILSQNELYEISVVPIPANPDALAKMKQRATRARHEDTHAPQTQDQDMTLAELQAALEKATADLAERDATIRQREADVRATEKTLADTRATLETVRAEHAKAVADRDEALKAAGEANDKLIELEVGALIGKKIAPVEKDAFVKLRKADKGLFEDMVSKRQPMKLDEQIVNDPAVKTAPGNADDLGDLIDGVEKTARN